MEKTVKLHKIDIIFYTFKILFIIVKMSAWDRAGNVLQLCKEAGDALSAIKLVESEGWLRPEARKFAEDFQGKPLDNLKTLKSIVAELEKVLNQS